MYKLYEWKKEAVNGFACFEFLNGTLLLLFSFCTPRFRINNNTIIYIFCCCFSLVSSILLLYYILVVLFISYHSITLSVSLERFILILMFLFVVLIWQRCDKQNIEHQTLHWLLHNVHLTSHQYSAYANNRAGKVPPIHCSFAITLWNCACYCNPCSKQASSVAAAKRTNEYTHINEWEKNSSSKNTIHNGKTEEHRSTGEERSGVYAVSILTSIHLRVF